MSKPLLFTAFCLTLLTAEASAQRGGGGRERGGEPPQSREFYESKGLFPTGLSPVFPKGVDCPGVSSAFGSSTRYDGSSRQNEHFGLHNGMDVTLSAGTPLPAMADGEVVHAGSAGRLVGNFIWLRFGPESTGLPAHIYARYQHLDQPSPLQPGDKVRRGQTVGLSGNSGTTGGHYGAAGYPHLHLNLMASPEADLEIRGAMMVGPWSVFLDPLGLFLRPSPTPFNNGALRDLAEAKKAVSVGVLTDRGDILPKDARIIWPAPCQLKKSK